MANIIIKKCSKESLQAIRISTDLLNNIKNEQEPKKEEEEKYEEEDTKVVVNENDRSKQIDNDNKKQNVELRKEYASKIFTFITWYTGIIGAILLFEGLGLDIECIDWINIDFETNVILTLITTTFASILGLMHIILNSIFPLEKKIKNKKII